MNDRRGVLEKFIGLSGLLTAGTVGVLSNAHAECACACNRESGCACVGHESCVCIGNNGPEKIGFDTKPFGGLVHPHPVKVGPVEEGKVLRISPSDSAVVLKDKGKFVMDLQDLAGLKQGDVISIRQIYSGDVSKGAVRVIK